jgi:hypothetical protein
MGIFCKRRIRVSNISLGGPYTKMTEVVFLQISNQTGDYAADQALYTVEANHMSQMVIIYITWQEMFQNGQTSSYDPNAYEYVSSMNQMY